MAAMRSASSIREAAALRATQPASAVTTPEVIIRAGLLDFLAAVVWLTMMFPHRCWVGLIGVTASSTLAQSVNRGHVFLARTLTDVAHNKCISSGTQNRRTLLYLDAVSTTWGKCSRSARGATLPKLDRLAMRPVMI
jgi:hypothetical protein